MSITPLETESYNRADVEGWGDAHAAAGPPPANRVDDPRRHAHGRLVLAAGPRESRSHRVPRGRERLHQGSAGPHRTAAGEAVRGDQVPYPGDRSLGPGPQGRVLVLLPHCR